MATITFPSNTTEIINSIRTAIGRTIYLETVASSIPCSVCTLDPITNTSTDSFCPTCFPKGTLVRTGVGYNTIEDIKIGDVVYSADGNLRPVVDTFKINTDKLIKITTSRLLHGLLCTPDHKVHVLRPSLTPSSNNCRSHWLTCDVPWCKKHKDQRKTPEKIMKRADELVSGDVLIVPKPKYIDLGNVLDIPDFEVKRNSTSTQLPEKLIIDKNTMSLFGWYLAEGGTKERGVTFTLGIDEEDVAEFISSVFSEYFNIQTTVKIIEEKNTILIFANGQKLVRFFQWLFPGNVYSKQISNSILNRSRDNLKYLLLGFFAGDGHERRLGEKTAVTTSRILAYQLFDIANYLGYLPSISFKKSRIDKNYVNHQSFYTISYFEASDNNKLCGQDLDNMYVVVKNISEILEKTTVYNIEVETDHNYTADLYAVENCSGHYWIDQMEEYPVEAHVNWGMGDIPKWETGGTYFDGDCTAQIEYTEANVAAVDATEYVVVDDRELEIKSKYLRGIPELNRIILNLVERSK